MDIVLSTDEVWQLDFEFEPVAFLAAAAQLMHSGDIAIFGAYEPTPELVSALKALGATARTHIPEFFTCFDANRREHPHGSAFEYTIGDSGFAEIIGLDRSVLRQTDIPTLVSLTLGLKKQLRSSSVRHFADQSSQSYQFRSICSKNPNVPNKAPEPTTMAVTSRAPSSTRRASHGRGSS